MMSKDEEQLRTDGNSHQKGSASKFQENNFWEWVSEENINTCEVCIQYIYYANLFKRLVIS